MICKSLRIVFMGTPEFAVPSLQLLVEKGYNIAGVVTQPDKPKGRGHSLSAPPVKECAVKKGIKVIQPEKLKTGSFFSELKEMEPDLLITAAYGRILPKDVLDLPRYGCINVHGSLLPKYRGAAPIHHAIINGEKITGITTMFTDVGMDTGDMLLKAEVEIPDDMTSGELHDILSRLGADVLCDTLKKLLEGTLVRIPQHHEDATYAPLIRKDTGLINWSNSSESIHNLVRGTNPWPCAYTYYKSERMRVWKAKPESISNASHPGTIYSAGKEGLYVSTGDGLLKIMEMQFDSSRKMSIEEYMAGHKINEGDILG